MKRELHDFSMRVIFIGLFMLLSILEITAWFVIIFGVGSYAGVPLWLQLFVFIGGYIGSNEGNDIYLGWRKNNPTT